MTSRLNQQNLKHLPDTVQLPGYDRTRIKPGIFHLGIGAFHRAHQAFYTDAVLNMDIGDWGIIGCSLRSPGVRDQLAPQDGLYTLAERSSTGNKLQIIGAVLDVMVAPENPAAVITAMADANIHIISLTITEKGYCRNPATGQLNLQDPDIIRDLTNPDTPVTAIGFLVAALKLRYQQQKPVTLLSCDNLPDNGDLLKQLILQFANQLSGELAAWIENNIAFPNTMIDRIVPATTDEDRQVIENQLGVRDEGLVITEPFHQWIIENNFVSGRPAWEKAGALLVNDVKIYEKIKLRLLNGAHSLMAYTGYLAGYCYISEVMENPAFVNMVTRYMNEDAGQTVAAPDGFDIENYKQQLCQRFSNPALKHRTAQIAMDGSQKLPQRLLGALREQLASDGSIDIICIAIAAWIRYVSGTDEQGKPINVADPLAETLCTTCSAHHGNPADMVRAVIGIEAVFGADLIHEERFVASTTRWLTRFYQRGVREVIEEYYG